jgi:hypothetical protein
MWRSTGLQHPFVGSNEGGLYLRTDPQHRGHQGAARSEVGFGHHVGKKALAIVNLCAPKFFSAISVSGTFSWSLLRWMREGGQSGDYFYGQCKCG